MKFCSHACLLSPVPALVMGVMKSSLKSPLASHKVFRTGIGLLLELVEFPFKCHELELVRIWTRAVIWTRIWSEVTRAQCTALSFAKSVGFYTHIDFIAKEEKWKNKPINTTALGTSCICSGYLSSP